MKQDTLVDHYRAHDSHVLHWLIQSHKFRLLITDMGKLAPGSVFNQTSLPPGERMEFQPVEQWHKAIWTGTKTILELFKETGACPCCDALPREEQASPDVLVHPPEELGHLVLCPAVPGHTS